MEFLVNIKITWPSAIPEDERVRLRRAEVALASELGKSGKLIRMWRVPGRRENWGLWRAEDPTQMHEILTSLPIWPFMDVEVHSLGVHPVDPLSLQAE